MRRLERLDGLRQVAELVPLGLVEDLHGQVVGQRGRSARGVKHLPEPLPAGVGEGFRLLRRVALLPQGLGLREQRGITRGDLAHGRGRFGGERLRDDRVRRLLRVLERSGHLGRAPGELGGGDRGEGVPGTKDGVRPGLRPRELRFPARDRTPEPGRIEAVAAGAVVELGVPRLEPEVERGLEAGGHIVAPVVLDLGFGGREVVVDLPLGGLELALEVEELGARFRGVDRGQVGRLDRAGEDAVERVVVVGRDRVELVVVAAGAGDREAEQAAGHDVDPVVEDVLLVVEEPPADRQEAERRERPRVVAARQAIGGDLLGDEAIVGDVVVEGPDHVVAIGVRIGIPALFHEDVALRIGITGHIEPVPPPALAVAGAGQEPIDDLGEGVGIEVGLERRDLLRRGRQAGEVERRATDQGPLVGLRSRAHPLPFEAGEDEGVDRRLDPRPVPDRGRIDGADRLEGPVGLRGPGLGVGGRDRPLRPGSAHLDPGRDRLDGRRGELAFGRHLDVFVRLPDGLDDQALVGLAWHDRRPVLPAFEDRLAGVEPEPRCLFARPVAFDARVGEDGADLRLEELDRLGRK